MLIKKKDLEILVELRKNARAQLTEISRVTHIPISTIYDRLKSNSNGIIKKHVSLIDFEHLGFASRAHICIKCGKTSKTEIFELLSKHQNVNSLYKINNGYDFMAEVIFRNIKDLEEFMECLEEQFSIKAKQVFYIIDEVVSQGFFSDRVYLDIVSPPDKGLGDHKVAGGGTCKGLYSTERDAIEKW